MDEEHSQISGCDGFLSETVRVPVRLVFACYSVTLPVPLHFQQCTGSRTTLPPFAFQTKGLVPLYLSTPYW